MFKPIVEYLLCILLFVTADLFPQTLPLPSGPFAIGRASYDWIDSSRAEGFSSQPGIKRELMVYAWYPARVEMSSRAAEYIPAFDLIERALGEGIMKDQFGEALGAIKSGQLCPHASVCVPLAVLGAPYPVLVFSHGFGETSLIYTAILEELASNGYVVFAIEHPYDAYCVAFPDGRTIAFAQAKWDSAKVIPKNAAGYQLAQIPVRAADILFVIDQVMHLIKQIGTLFSGHLDAQRIGVFGHSLGGMAAARACQLDPRIRAGMNQDAEYQGFPFIKYSEGESIQQPFLFFATDHSLYVSKHIPPPTDQQLQSWKMIRTSYDSLMAVRQKVQDTCLATMPGGSYRIRAEGDDFVHRSFIDTYLFKSGTNSVGSTGKLRNLETIRSYTKAFFDKYLKDARSTLLDQNPLESSGISIDRFRSDKK